MYLVIRAGGKGTRLWPLSRKHQPKQFHALVSEKPMLYDTWERIQSITSQNELFISVNIEYLSLLKRTLPFLPDTHIIAEPVSKNTGPAVCLEACYLEEKGLLDEVVASIPSDDYISHPESFCDMLVNAHAFVKEHPDMIMTPGAIPTQVDVGYSYLRRGHELWQKNGFSIYHVDEWVEKPAYAQCKALIASRQYIAHTGMYIWKISTLLSAFSQFQPEMLSLCREIVKTNDEEKKFSLYSQLPKESIEKTLISKLNNIALIGSEKMGWSDLGKWRTLYDLLEKDAYSNVRLGNVQYIDSTKNFIKSQIPKKKVVLIGVHDMVIVDTPDALLICEKHETEKMADILNEIPEEYH